MIINSVKIFLRQNGSRESATASVMLNNSLLLHEIEIRPDKKSPSGYRLFYPKGFLPDQPEHSVCFYPISDSFAKELETKILEAYRQVKANPASPTVQFSNETPEEPFEVSNTSVTLTSKEHFLKSGWKAKVKVDLDGELRLCMIKLMERNTGALWIKMPSIVTPKAKRNIDVYHPMNRETRDLLTVGILEEYSNTVNRNNRKDQGRTYYR